MIGIYLRVSSDKQDETMQLHHIKRCLIDEEFNTAKIYKDFGITGTTTERPDYQKLLLDVNSGIVTEKIAVYEFSRLWRDLEEQNRMLKVLKALGIKLFSATEGFVTTDEDKLKANILGATNVYEVERLTRRIRDGIARKKKDIADGKDTWRGRGKDKKMRKRPTKKYRLINQA